jgi:transmembrane sensor
MTIDADIEEKALHWFVLLRDEAAPDSVWSDFQQWLEVGPEHARAYDAVERLWIELDGAAAPEVAPVVSGAVVDLAAVRARKAPRRAPWAVAGLGIAASLVLGVGVWSQMRAAGADLVYATDDQPRQIALEDGSRVHLNRHSELHVRFAGDRRAVELTNGEAAFDIAHDATHPFTVDAGDRRVEVLGTAFNVLSHDDRFSVAVERGVVAVSTDRKSAGVRLTAGQAISQVGRAAPVLSRLTPDQASTWRRGVLVYRDQSLDDVADDLSRYLDKPVVLSASAKALHFTGALRVGDEAVMLKQLQDFVPVRAVTSAKDVRLTAREAG